MDNVWFPSENQNSKNFTDTDDYLNSILTDIASMPRESISNIVSNLIKTGFVYHAARCLEISSQHNIGVFFTGKELINYRYPSFGDFHKDIKSLLEAGCLYLKVNRERTASITFNRALSFVEEALRQLDSYEEDSTKDVLCLGLAFELAGHCCLPTKNTDGIAYYEAAKKYWKMSYEIDPEEVESWKNHNVTKTVLSALQEVAKVKVQEESSLIQLKSMNYNIRINKALEFVSQMNN